MKRIRYIRRVAGVLAGLASILLGLSTTAPAAHATLPPPEPAGTGGAIPPPAETSIVITGGMPGWQITLIAVGAALCAAIAAVFLDRARAARRHVAT